MGDFLVGNRGVLGIRYFLWWKRILDLGKAGDGWFTHGDRIAGEWMFWQ